MYIYNVTVSVEESAHEAWLTWMIEEHIPLVMKTACFVEYRILRVLAAEDEGRTFSVQYYFKEMADIENYQKNFAPALQADHRAKFGDKANAFRTLLEIIK